MKRVLLLLLFAAAARSAGAQAPLVSQDPYGNKVLLGLMSRKDVEKDPAFPWYAKNLLNYKPQSEALTALRAAKDSVHVLVFAGTWCADTKFLLPKFFALTDSAGFDSSRIALIGVDREKKTVHGLSEAFALENVPTFIVLKNGVEIGRVVEYGKTGNWEKELGEIVSSPRSTVNGRQ